MNMTVDVSISSGRFFEKNLRHCEFCHCCVPKGKYKEVVIKGKKIHLCNDGDPNSSCFKKWSLKEAKEELISLAESFKLPLELVKLIGERLEVLQLTVKDLICIEKAVNNNSGALARLMLIAVLLNLNI